MGLASARPCIGSDLDLRLKVPLRVYSAGGTLMAEFGEERRIPVRVAEVPPLLVQAVLAAEDDGFYAHRGVDPMGILRAALANLRTGQTGQGASTITMQVARNVFLSPEKTYTRKLKEVLLAFKIERELAKDEILELYLNKIFLGHRAYGFGSAAQVYYGVPLKDLNVAQIAMLAGLPKAPSRNNPLSRPDNARERRDYVLRRMRELGDLDEATFQLAVSSPLTARKYIAAAELEAPYVAEMVRRYMVDKYGDNAYGEGYRVYTTIRADLQQAANRAVRVGLLRYDRRHGYRGPIGTVDVRAIGDKSGLDHALRDFPVVGELMPAVVLEVQEQGATGYTARGQLVDIPWPGLSWARRYLEANAMGPAPKNAAEVVQLGDVVYVRERPPGSSEAGSRWELSQLPQVAGALVSLRPRDGAIIALTGGFNFYQSKFNRVVQAVRQPGSNIKPFIYSAALEKGFTAASLVSGAPIVIRDAGLEDVWRPENYSGKFFGAIRLREALARSVNLVSVRILRTIGPRFAIKHMVNFGFDRKTLPNNLSLALGSGSLTPLSVVTAYAVFANGGYRVEPYFIERVEDGLGQEVERANPTRVCPTCLLEVELSAMQEVPEPVGMPIPADARAPEPAEELQTTDAYVPPAPRFAARAISPENAFVMTSMMRDVIRVGTGRRALVLGRGDLAGKTGTTNEFRDAWFSGFNPDVATSVWVGFDQPATLGKREAGGRAALPIWIDFMDVALKGVPESALVPDRKSTRLNSSHTDISRMPSSA